MAHLAMLVVYVCLCIIIVTKANPITGGRKITFSTATSIDYSKIEFNEKEVPTGTPEYYESHKWVAVNNEGMEYEGTLEEVMMAMETAEAREDMGDDTVGKPHPTTTSMLQEDIPGQEPSSFNNGPGQEPLLETLKQAMVEAHYNVEKRSVIGTDERRQVTPNRFPYTAIGQVEIGCTGTFIAPRTVLTSGHCVHSGGSGGSWYQNINVKRQKDCDPNQGTTHTWRWAVTFTGWFRHGYISHDMAIITVYQASPDIMVFASANTIRLEIINIAGYPGDKPNRCLWASHCTLGEVTDTLLKYPCDTAGGMSGSGVYKFWTPNTRIIYGVHGYGASGYPLYNKAVRMTSSYEATIRRIIPQFQGN